MKFFHYQVPLSKLKFNNSFAKLGDSFFTRIQPTGLPNPKLVSVNLQASALLGLEQRDLSQDWFLQWSSGNKPAPDSDPLAMVYSGHQFGGYSPQLGDGRGLLLGEVEGPQGKWDVHLKGAGSTPYSRFGDGRAVLRSTIREYLCSEAMNGLGIASTRALSITAGKEPVYRETVEPAAMLIRLARSHIRFGSFEYFHHTQKSEYVKQLADHVIEQHLPALSRKDGQYLEMFRSTVHSTAKLIAQWQAIGFAHGVMNTDNMSMIGETMDYGPFGFLDTYNPEFICNHSDTSGRYAFKRQPMIGLWNCNALANALTSLIPIEQLKIVLEEYEPLFLSSLLELQRKKLGLFKSHPDDQDLVDALLNILADNQVDYTIFFRSLCSFDENKDHSDLRDLFLNRESFDHWAKKYRHRLALEQQSSIDRQAAMLKINPKYVFRNYMAEIAIRKAEDEKDYSEIDRMLSLLQAPFDEHPDCEEYAKHPPEWSQKLSVSCSS
jgi:protein adenylyltransferase